MIDVSESETLTVTLGNTGECQIALSKGLSDEPMAHSMLVLLEQIMPDVWAGLSKEMDEHPFFTRRANQPFQVGVILVSNSEIQSLNHSYRQKNEATDVLSFPLMDFNDPLVWQAMPVVDLGEVYVSLPWAQEAVAEADGKAFKFSEKLPLYILERIIHGCLHLLGVHHDTIPAYNRVKAIQSKVINGIVQQVQNFKPAGG